MKRFLLPLLLALLATLQVSAYKKQSIDINVNGQNRNMVVFTPNTLPARSPLLIAAAAPAPIAVKIPLAPSA